MSGDIIWFYLFISLFFIFICLFFVYKGINAFKKGDNFTGFMLLLFGLFPILLILLPWLDLLFTRGF